MSALPWLKAETMLVSHLWRYAYLLVTELCDWSLTAQQHVQELCGPQLWEQALSALF